MTAAVAVGKSVSYCNKKSDTLSPIGQEYCFTYFLQPTLEPLFN